MKKLIVEFLTLGIVKAMPPGMTADNAAFFGLMGLISNVNAQGESQVEVATAGTNVNLTAAQVIAGATSINAGVSGPFTITLPSTAAILAALGPTIPTDGTFSKTLNFKNDATGQTGTVTAGDASTTLSGTMTIATATVRTIMMTVTGPTTVQFENFGSASL